MTREEHLRFCKICIHRKKDLNVGIVCGLTDRIAVFQEECATFQQNTKLKQTQEGYGVAHSVRAKVADKGKRFTNYLIDQLFVLGFGFIIGAVLGLALAVFAPEHLGFFNEGNRLFDYGLGICITLLYYSFFEGFTGRSLGKFITKTKVVTEDGERPNFGTIFVRSLCRNIPFNALSFLSSDAVGWHDQFSKTRVVEMD